MNSGSESDAECNVFKDARFWLVTDRPLITEYRQFPSNGWVLFSKKLRHVSQRTHSPARIRHFYIKNLAEQSGIETDAFEDGRPTWRLTLGCVSRMRSAGSGQLPVRRACYLNYTHQTTTPARPTVISSADIVLAIQFVHMRVPRS